MDSNSLGNLKRIVVSTTPPMITAVMVLSPDVGVTYTAGDRIDISVAFSAPVAVQGTPVLWLKSKSVGLSKFEYYFF